MVGQGETFVVPVTINGQITLDFIVDSGAADVNIPADVVMTLIRTGTITDNDFLGKETYRTPLCLRSSSSFARLKSAMTL